MTMFSPLMFSKLGSAVSIPPFASVPSTSKLSPESDVFYLDSVPSLRYQEISNCNKEREVPLVPIQTIAKLKTVEETDHWDESKVSVQPAKDFKLLADDRVLVNLLRLEEVQRPNLDYFSSIHQPDLKPHMRQITIDWMCDVCEEEKADVEVLVVAVRLLDRFLALQGIFKQQLQGLATTCLFLASKLIQPVAFSATKLVKYTDNSVSMGELMSWELLVLNKLDWDVSCVTAFDFVELLLCRCGFPKSLLGTLRPNVHRVISKLQTDHVLAFLPPSIQASASLSVAALMSVGDGQNLLPFILQATQSATGVDPEQLYPVVEALDRHIYSLTTRLKASG